MRETLAAIIDIVDTILALVFGIIWIIHWIKYGFEPAIPYLVLSQLFWISSELMADKWGIGHW